MNHLIFSGFAGLIGGLAILLVLNDLKDQPYDEDGDGR